MISPYRRGDNGLGDFNAYVAGVTAPKLPTFPVAKASLSPVDLLAGAISILSIFK